MGSQLASVTDIATKQPVKNCLDCIYLAVSPRTTFCTLFEEHLVTNEAPDCDAYDAAT